MVRSKYKYSCPLNSLYFYDICLYMIVTALLRSIDLLRIVKRCLTNFFCNHIQIMS